MKPHVNRRPIKSEIFETIINVSSEAVWVNDFEASQSYWVASAANKKRYQLPDDDTAHSFWQQGLHPEDKQLVVGGYQRALEDPSITHYEHEYRFLGNTKYYTIFDRMQFFRDENGRALCVIGIWTDRSDIIERENQLNELVIKLHEDREQFKLIAKLTNTVVFKIDYREQLIYWTAGNDALENYGLENTVYPLSVWTTLIHADDRDRAIAKFNGTVASGFSRYADQFRYVSEKIDSVRHLSVKGFIKYDYAGKPKEMLGGFSDITLEVEQENTLRSLLEQQRNFNRILQDNERELAANEEALRTSNQQLLANLRILEEREAQLKETHKRAEEAYKQIGELRLVALRSAMNPHFIFNALSSIQYFIAKNNRKSALDYLSTFSKLIRGILTSSVNNTTLLENEIELLRCYIELELLRFENKFTYQIIVDPTLETGNIEIPSLLIQPYVENAIIHGLYNKDGKGNLLLEVKPDNNRLLIMITDNGVGRKKARQNDTRHHSMGSVLTEERLKLINHQRDAHLEIIDIESNGMTGTIVKIWITL